MPVDGLSLISAEDVRWDERLREVPHDFYHRRGYHAVAEWNGEGQARLAVFRSGDALLAWPYLQRPIEGTEWFDVGCVYGYPGPVGIGLDAQTTQGAWCALREAWHEQGVVSVFTSFNPMLANSQIAGQWRAEPSGPTPVAALGRSVALDLSRTRDERWAAYEKQTRYEVRRAERIGLTTVVDSGGDHLGDLARLYAQTMDRNRAAGRYRFEPAYFERLWASLDGLGHLLVAAFEGEVVGVLLFVVDGERAHAHLTGVAPEALRLSVLNAMLDAAADAARDRGARLLHLGAGRGGQEDSLYRFKRRIADVEFPFEIGRWVLDAERYAELTNARCLSGADCTSFFPAYRQSLAG